MVPNQAYKILYSKENHKEDETTTYRLRENSCKWSEQQGLDFQNIPIAHTTQ